MGLDKALRNCFDSVVVRLNGFSRNQRGQTKLLLVRDSSCGRQRTSPAVSFCPSDLTAPNKSHRPPLCHPERTRISYFTALSAATYAALHKESRMKSVEATVFDRKSGGAEGPAVRPGSRTKVSVLYALDGVGAGRSKMLASSIVAGSFPRWPSTGRTAAAKAYPCGSGTWSPATSPAGSEGCAIQAFR